MPDCPFDCVTPITRNGRFLTRMTFPTGSSSTPNRFSTTVLPRMATSAAASTSSLVNTMPLFIGHIMMSK